MAAWLVGFGPGCGAQTAAPFTLHAYANLMQFPVLVLNSDREPLAGIDGRRLQVSLDGGEFFSPRNVRREGDDPIDLAIVLDVKNTEPSLVNGFAKALADASGSLQPQDRISIYALGCNLLMSADAIPPDAERLHTTVENALQSPALRTCEHPVHLREGLAVVAEHLGRETGRRVLLAVTDGSDPGGRMDEEGLREFADHDAVAIFELVEEEKVDELQGPAPFILPASSRFELICEDTGGMLISASAETITARLRKFVALLRGRYIVEFPRPQKMQKGAHQITVKLRGDPAAFVRATGLSVPLPDPRRLADPTTIPSQAGANIPMGDKRPTSRE
jgi:hypothetical protein